MMRFIHEELRFLETNVARGEHYIVDTTVEDAGIPIPDWVKTDYKGMYK